MKVLMFGWEFPPYISGGLGTACFGLTKGLNEHGVGVTFVVPTLATGAEGGHVDLVGADNIKITAGEAEKLLNRIETLRVGSPLTPYLSVQEYSELLNEVRDMEKKKTFNLSNRLTGSYGPDLMSEIARYSSVAGPICRERPCDVIHAHDWMTFPAGIEARKTGDRPFVAHIHATEFDRNGDHINQDVYDIEREGLHAADRVVTVSEFTKGRLVERYGIDESKVDVVHNGILDTGICRESFPPRNLKEKIVLFLGRITFQKGPEYFIEAAKKVIDTVPDVRFVMAGSGDMFPRMVEKMAAMRLGRYFHFTGFLRGRDVDRMYAMSDLYVMPSVSEPFGISPLEAMRHDIPVIISKQSGVAEVVDHAVKIDFWDVDQIAGSIIRILSDREAACRMVEANRKNLALLSWGASARKIIATYNRVAGIA